MSVFSEILERFMATDVLRVNQKRQQFYEEVKASILESRRMSGNHCSKRKLAELANTGHKKKVY